MIFYCFFRIYFIKLILETGDIMSILRKYDGFSIKDISKYFFILVSSFCFSLISEYIFRSSLIETFIWIVNNPISYLANLLIVFTFAILLTSAFNSYRVGLSITCALVILSSVINKMKISFRGIPFVPKDLYLNNELFTIVNVVLTAGLIKLLFMTVLIISFLILLIMNLPRLSLQIKERLLLLTFSIVLIFSFVHTDILNNVSRNRDGINCNENGFILFFVSNIHDNPKNLSFEYIVNKIENSRKSKDNSSNINKVKPNIIVIMSEAFWDPSEMKQIQFSKSPTPNIDKLKGTSIYGYLESPTFGGGTANTEFEFLTGNSAHFYNPGYMVYPNEIKGPIIAIPSILKKQGYTTKALHSFKNWYWNRREVYSHMGFDEYISEEYLINPSYKGFFISDEYVTDTIIQEIEKSTDPLFLFAVTMQNHGPYNDNRYGDSTKDITISGNLSSESLKILETYTQGVYDADKALGKLIDYCSNTSKPTIVLFFGDHLPVLGENYRVYKESGYLSNNNNGNNNEIKLSSVPFLLWSNYNTLSKDLGLLNTSFMAPYLLEYGKLDMPNYFKFLQSFSKEIPVISRSYAIDKKGIVISSSNERYVSYNDDYMLVQQDIVYGDKVFEDDYINWIVSKNPNYNSRLKTISIDQVILKEKDVIIKGNNFYPNCSLLIDNKSYKFKYINCNEIHIKRKYITSGSKLKLSLVDSKNNLMAESDIYTLK